MVRGRNAFVRCSSYFERRLVAIVFRSETTRFCVWRNYPARPDLGVDGGYLFSNFQVGGLDVIALPRMAAFRDDHQRVDRAEQSRIWTLVTASNSPQLFVLANGMQSLFGLIRFGSKKECL